MSNTKLLLKIESKKKSGWLAAFLNLVLPGAGYAYCGRWILGLIVFPFVVFLWIVSFGLAAIPFMLIVVADGFLAAGRYNKKLIAAVLAEEEAKEKSSPADPSATQSTSPASPTSAPSSPNTKIAHWKWGILGAVIGGAILAIALALIVKQSQNKPQAAVADTTAIAEKAPTSNGAPISNSTTDAQAPGPAAPTASIQTPAATVPAPVLPSAPPPMATSAPNAQTDERVTWAPSFDCGKVSSGAERLICSNRELSAADVKLAQLYRIALNGSSNKDVVKREQISWLKTERGACSDVECMLKAYQNRIAQLSR